jgi:hypothetical protein
VHRPIKPDDPSEDEDDEAQTEGISSRNDRMPAGTDEAFAPVDVDLNLVQNLLDSYSFQEV